MSDKTKIKGMLEEKVDEIFLVMQKEMGITNGDIAPLMALRLDEELDRVTEMIRDVLGMQNTVTDDKIKKWCSRHNAMLIEVRKDCFACQKIEDGTWWFVPYGDM